jgi:hypothetical protein
MPGALCACVHRCVPADEIGECQHWPEFVNICLSRTFMAVCLSCCHLLHFFMFNLQIDHGTGNAEYQGFLCIC